MDRARGGGSISTWLRRVLDRGAMSLMLACAAGTAHAAADLGITIQTGNATPTAGGAAFSYTIVVTNYGPDDALGIVMLDPLPPSIKVANANIAVVNSPSVPGWGLICESPPLDTVGGTVKCTGNLPAPTAGPVNSTSTITIVAQVVADTASGVRTNTASVIADTPETNPNTNPNTASVQQNITVNAPLSLSMAASADVVAGDPILYQISLSNGGSSSAINSIFTQALPAGTQFLALFGSRDLHDACYAVGGGAQVICQPKTLASGTHHLVVLAETFAATTPEGPAQSTTTLNNAGTGTPVVAQASATTEVSLNAAPVAVNDSYLTNKDTPLVVAAPGVKANDSDDEDLQDVFVASLVAGPTNGTLTVPLGANGSFTYTPNAGFTGVDTFTYRNTDSRGLEGNIATVTITVNAPPVAVNDGYLTNQNTPLVVATLGVKVNDTDDLDTQAQLVASLVAGPANGSLSVPLNANGSFTYTPNALFTGTDTFTYRVTDTGGLQSNVATVTITVNAPPVAVNDGYLTNRNTPLVVATLGVKVNDTDDLDTQAQLVASLVTGPANGSLSVPLNADGSFTYTPNALFTGTDTFTYRVTDTGGLQSNVATVTITVNAPPVAVNDQYTLQSVDGSLVVPALGVKTNDSDDLDTREQLVASLVTGPLNGSLTVPLAADGSFTYTPNAGFAGTDTFTYVVTDTNGLVSNIATVTIVIFAPLERVPLSPWMVVLAGIMLATLGAATLRARRRPG